MTDPTRRIPFGQDFTPRTLGKRLGEDAVLGWLLETASAGSRAELARKVANECLSHVSNEKDRRDMATHVFNAMRAYGLVSTGDGDAISLTPEGELLRGATVEERDVLFARHIITMCNGQLFLDAIRRYELRGEAPDMEELSIELGEPATSKNLSTVRAWLARAGVMTGGSGPYHVIEGGWERVVGEGVAKYYGLDRDSLELLLAAKIVQLQQGPGLLDAVVVAKVADSRGTSGRIRRKSLGRLVKALEAQGHVKVAPARPGKGGSRTAFELLDKAVHITEQQIRELLAQSDAGFPLSELLPLAEVVPGLGEGTAERIGWFGEQLAVHLCLMLGLRVRSWRKRAPAEIDLIAERLSSLTYQRWVVQVKNTVNSLDVDQVDREVGATAGLGVSHILFVVPRAEATQDARREMEAKSRLTHLHIYLLTGSMVNERRAEPLLDHLREQAWSLEASKRNEAESREQA